MRVPNVAALLLVLLTGAGPLVAQTDLVRNARELERRGRYEDAIALYRDQLRTDPADFQALVGLERIYTRLGRPESLVVHLGAAAAAAPASEFVRELQVRVWSAMKQEDSVEAVIAGWIEAAPESPTPYRQWAFWLAQRGHLPRAREVLRAGQVRLGEEALAREVAEVLAFGQEWVAATDAWRQAARSDETVLPAAVTSLREAPAHLRGRILARLEGEAAGDADRRLAADLLLTWGRAEEAWTRLDSALPEDRSKAIEILSQFAERARQVRTPGGARARGFAMERLADLTGGAAAEGARLEAARAFADAGDLRAAQRLLGRVSLDPRDREPDAAATMAALIRVLADAGRPDEAEELFQRWAGSLRGDDAAQLREKLAWARVREGELEQAERLIVGDSSVGVQAVLGWIALYRGDLTGATERFRAAGPYAQSREEATRRTQVLALIQRVTRDTVPRLGSALQRLGRGDTARAVRELADAGRRLPPRGGRAALFAFAGELALETGDYNQAEELLLDALAVDSQGPSAPAAQYALAVSYAKLGRSEDAVGLLEGLILNHPESAVVPQARRFLDQLKGMRPSS